MDKNRLLTDEELVTVTDNVCKKYKTTWANMVDGALNPIQLEQFVIDVYTETAATQDAKTAAIVQAATLRAVGEAFEARSFVVTSNIPDLDGKTAVYLEQLELTALRNGQWPAGWERKE